MVFEGGDQASGAPVPARLSPFGKNLGVGVERTFPAPPPKIEKLEVARVAGSAGPTIGRAVGSAAAWAQRRWGIDEDMVGNIQGRGRFWVN